MIKSLLKRSSLSLATTALAVGVVTGAQAGTLSIGHTTWVGYGTLYLARDLGYFKEQGLDLQLTTMEESSMYMAAQASGQLSGSASTIDEILKYRPQFCFKAVAALDDSYGGDGVLVGKEVNSLQELKGKAIAVNEGSVSQFWLSYLLKQNGMSMSDLQVQNMTADDAATAFIAGRIPAAVTWEPHLSLVRQKGQGKVLIDSTKTPGIIVDVVALNCDVIEKQPEDVKALVNGLYKAVQYTKEHPQEAYAIMAKGVGGYLADPLEMANAAKGVRFYDQPMSEKLLGTPGKPGDIAELIELANQTWSSLQGKPFAVSYDDLVDSTFVSP
ncbi:taurine ABC transporter substrate-binding protein [Pseudomonas cavernicola]|uniref:Taurine ABC transporter substrate-binding protein n=1 Tax=Pseudomonas cavernicola TaxID=2320866 RepID=A0A418XK47_9PSED|nr:ABC transporter substrate-binding protein [Pseudomonas cavernicola]RJG12843.1 taurine ABC transporter substrate-binding protein [Pseudomonas cavernicola]